MLHFEVVINFFIYLNNPSKCFFLWLLVISIISYALILLALYPRNINRKHHTFSFPPLKSSHSQSPLAAIKDFLSEIRFYYILPSKFFYLTMWQKLILHSGRDGKEKVSKFLSEFELCGQCGGAVRDSFRISGLHALNFSLPKRLLHCYPVAFT